MYVPWLYGHYQDLLGLTPAICMQWCIWYWSKASGNVVMVNCHLSFMVNFEDIVVLAQALSRVDAANAGMRIWHRWSIIYKKARLVYNQRVTHGRILESLLMAAIMIMHWVALRHVCLCMWIRGRHVQGRVEGIRVLSVIFIASTPLSVSRQSPTYHAGQ